MRKNSEHKSNQQVPMIITDYCVSAEKADAGESPQVIARRERPIQWLAGCVILKRGCGSEFLVQKGGGIGP